MQKTNRDGEYARRHGFSIFVLWNFLPKVFLFDYYDRGLGRCEGCEFAVAPGAVGFGTNRADADGVGDARFEHFQKQLCGARTDIAGDFGEKRGGAGVFAKSEVAVEGIFGDAGDRRFHPFGGVDRGASDEDGGVAAVGGVVVGGRGVCVRRVEEESEGVAVGELQGGQAERGLRGEPFVG